jgi:hypothetical protein
MDREFKYKIIFVVFCVIIVIFSMFHIRDYFGSFTVYELPGISYPFSNYIDNIDLNFDMKDYDEGVLYIMPFLSLIVMGLGLILMIADIKYYSYTFIGIAIVRSIHVFLIWNYLSSKLFFRSLGNLYVELTSTIIIALGGIVFIVMYYKIKIYET